MFTVPGAIHVTSPVKLTDAIKGLLLLHVPPGVPSTTADVWPTQLVESPVIGPGSGLTDITTGTLQPEPNE